MDPQNQDTVSNLDTLYLIVAILLICGGMFAFYYFDRQFAFLPRLGMLAAGVAIGIAIGYRTHIGQLCWGAIMGSRIEMRKVVWPSRQQSVQATLMVAAVVLLTALFLWLVDSSLLAAMKLFNGTPS